jgi:uncharacterized membrane protein YbaN (DUF454 family)
MARLHRMYVRLLFVVVGIFGVFLARFPSPASFLPAEFRELRLGRYLGMS